MAYAIGHVSGCHLNPAVTVGLAVARRTEKKDIVPYILSQVLGGLLGAYTLYLIASGVPSFDIINGFALNGVADFSPTGASLMSGIICEVVMTMMFLIIILGATSKGAPKGFGPIAIGLGLTLIHLISIPVTNTSVNPARSTAVALIAGGEILSQLWIFWIMPIIGAILGAILYKFFIEEK